MRFKFFWFETFYDFMGFIFCDIVYLLMHTMYINLIIFVDKKTHENPRNLNPTKINNHMVLCIHCLMIYYWCRFVLRDGQLWLGHAQAILVSNFV